MKQLTFVKALKFASHAMAKKDIRYCLNGVLLEVSGLDTYFIGTDGNRMAITRFYSADGHAVDTLPDGQYIIPGTDVDLMLKIFDGKNTSPLYITLSPPGAEQTLAFKSYGRKHVCSPVDGKYPDWRRVARINDQAKSVPSFNVNAAYLAQGAKACGALSNKYGAVTLTNYGDDMASFRVAPATIEAEGVLEAFCIIMPTRV